MVTEFSTIDMVCPYLVKYLQLLVGQVHHLGRYPPDTPPGQVHHQAGTPHPPGQVHPPLGQVHHLGRYPPDTPSTWAGTLPQAGTLPGKVHSPWAGTPPRQVHPLPRGVPTWGVPAQEDWMYTHLGRYTPGQVHLLRAYTPHNSACWEIRATSRRYASYWNAFLLENVLEKIALYTFCRCKFSAIGNPFSSTLLHQMTLFGTTENLGIFSFKGKENEICLLV